MQDWEGGIEPSIPEEDTMAPSPAQPGTSRILAAISAHVRRLGTNPYRIARSSGMPLTTVQRLLTVPGNVPLRNVEMLMAVLGLDYDIVPHRLPSWLSGSGPHGGKWRAEKRRSPLRER